MKPFPVYCETCGVRLKVRDASAVGEIHACPKCESMVLIAVPAGWRAETADTAPATTQATSADLVAPTDFASEVDDLLETPEPTTAAQDVAVEEIASPLEPVELAMSAVAGGKTGVAVWGTAGVVAFFAIGVLGAAWWSRAGDAPETVTQVAQPPVIQTETQEETSAPVVVAAAKPVAEVAEETPVVTPAVEPEVEPESPAPLPELPSLPDVEPEVEAPAPAKPQAAVIDPLAIDSANLDLLLVRESPVAETPPPEETVVEDLSEPRVAIVPRPERRFEAGSTSRGPSFAEAFAEGELQSRLAMRLQSVRWKDAPLHQALGELGSLAGVPITIDPAALRMAAVPANLPVSVEKQDATVADLASAITAAARLEVVERHGGLVVVKPGAKKARKVDYRVDDLVAVREPDASSVAEFLQTYIAPGNWPDDAIAVNGNSLAINQQAAVQYEVLLFCERLRQARGLATRSRYPSELIETEPRLARLSVKMSRPTTFAFVDWTPLVQVFNYWHETSGVTVLVDWTALADQDLRPLATMAGSVNHLSWFDALDKALHPLGLDWTAVDGQTIQITSREAASEIVWVEFYAAADAEELRQHIAEACDEASLAELVIQSDATGKFVLVRGNRQVHKAALAGRGE